MSLLMCSDSAAHYDPLVKSNEDKIDYIRKSFTSDFSSWLLNEPADKLAWNIDFVSNFYERGNSLTVAEFDDLASKHCTPWFHESVLAGKKIVIPWHKNVLPAFLGKDVLSISLDKPSMKWFARSVWAKHHGMERGKIHIKENDPLFYRADPTNHARFRNPIYVEQSRFSFIKNNIYGSNEALFFSDHEKLSAIGSKLIIELGDLLEIERLRIKLEEIYAAFNIVPIDRYIVDQGFLHWRSLHEY